MIKVFIIAAATADGFIAKDSKHPAVWTSKADKKRFIEITKRAGVVIMGLNTYKTLGRPLKERLNIIYAPENTDPKEYEGAEITQDKPADLIKKLEERGFKEVAICGGSTIYTMFMKSNVVDTLYLTIEPILFGKGMNLFNDDLKYHLKLKSAQTSESTGTLLLEYSVDYTGTPKLTI
jgi:dihydrofolate reductase